MRHSRVFAFGLSAVLLAASATGTQAAPPPPAPVLRPQAATPAVPPPEVGLMMVRQSLLAYNDANLTNNYSVLLALSGPTFQRVQTLQSLSEQSKVFRDNAINLLPVAFINPNFTAAPVIKDGKISLDGTFPTTPMNVRFNLVYEAVLGQWKLAELNVGLVPAQAAPAPTAPAAPAAQKTQPAAAPTR